MTDMFSWLWSKKALRLSLLVLPAILYCCFCELKAELRLEGGLIADGVSTLVADFILPVSLSGYLEESFISYCSDEGL